MTKLKSLFALLEHSQRPAISPKSFLSASQPFWFTPGSQQDCSEYLKYLLNRLHEEEKAGKIYYQKLKESSLMSQAMEHQSINKTLIEKMFWGKMITKIRCLKCLNISSRKEAFTDLSLVFPPSDRTHIVCRRPPLESTRARGSSYGRCRGKDCDITEQGAWPSDLSHVHAGRPPPAFRLVSSSLRPGGPRWRLALGDSHLVLVEIVLCERSG
ncbi:ubiquitin carboxyl-terminal hydrolase 35-like [Coturnix japonica]|uniref:ubiquitin carboxyl-terminal hydrolase 35-like n=1 Tax=Coturnix japonica TaxID=93934 RepID=UPI0013A5EB24|nr:ubiquitin carboxyl-terminal hydrolase 35-like [Coturnix japonica]